jgi:hypothetical protein
VLQVLYPLNFVLGYVSNFLTDFWVDLIQLLNGSKAWNSTQPPSNPDPSTAEAEPEIQ